MPKICYQKRNFTPDVLATIAKANAILGEYAGRGITVTLRQLYYQFVARGLLANNQKNYKRLGDTVNNARLAGLIDWNYMQDRTRNLRGLQHWQTPGEIIAAAANSYQRDLWAGQKYHVEVWIEKDALVGVIEAVCSEHDVAFFSCRGYVSQSEMWVASQRLLGHVKHGQKVRLIHLGDHDPSGKDMTRDITDRLELFIHHHLWDEYISTHPRATPEGETVEQYKLRLARKLTEHTAGVVEISRIALNMDQIERYSPPPNPTKLTDSRAGGYMAEFGGESWELDALDPDVLVELIRDHIEKWLDAERYAAEERRQESEREVLTHASQQWPDVANYIKRKFGKEGPK